MRRSSWPERIAEAAASKKKRIRLLLGQMKGKEERADDAIDLV
jgi:hypothetical protein